VVEETVSTTNEVTKAPTTQETGETTYTATFTNTLFSVQTKAVSDIPVMVQAPALPAAVSFSGSKTISITCETDGAVIYYSTDKSAPDHDSIIYTGPFSINATTTVKAIAVKEGMSDSEIVSAEYSYVSDSEDTPVYPPAINKTDNGYVRVSPTNPQPGDQVVITPVPDEGYTIGAVVVTNRNGDALGLVDSGNGTYSFTQPDDTVVIDVTFTEETAVHYADVPEDSYYFDAVAWAAQEGITNGTDETHFSPSDPCTRAQVLTFLWRAAGCPEPSMTSSAFTDLDETMYYYKAVLWASENGITNGTSSTTFGPDDIVTRAQTVTFLFRAMGDETDGSESFVDVSQDSLYYQAILWASESGITNGTSNTTFSPDNDCIRAQVVTFLYRAYHQD